ncbi:MAG: hypothetical protein ACLQF1_18075 [Methyloceanibacter sp.]|jgi:hypothetical protein
MTHVSAISEVERTGYELVKCRKTKGKLATMRDYARVDFKPWKGNEDGKLIPSDETLLNCGVSARMANAVMLQSKEELVGMFDDLPIEVIDEMMVGLVQSAEVLKATIIMLETAYLRIRQPAHTRLRHEPRLGPMGEASLLACQPAT